MKFGLKMLIAGSGAVLVGLWFLGDGLSGGPMNEIIGGMLWKGPLLIVVGAAGAFMGFRMLKEIVAPNPDDTNPPTKSPDDQRPNN